MPSSKSVTVERVRNGQRDVMFATDLPTEMELRVATDKADGHTHLVFGFAADLNDAGVKADVKRVRTAKKPAAKKPAAKEA